MASPALSPFAFAVIGVGAALGAWARWLLATWFNDPSRALPFGTLIANLAGGLLIGFVLSWLEGHPGIDPHWRLAIVTGFLGALTTFSTFSAELFALLASGRLGWAFAHAALHLLGSLLAVVIGFRLAGG